NADGFLWPGQFVTVRLRIGLSPRATVVPPRAVKQGLEGPFVFRVNNGKAEVVPVSVGYATDQEAVITKGIVPGETIVSDGQSRLKDGAPVKVVEGTAGGAVAEESH
ncbi:MAG: efflux RND transporter periplasmic adaptor subunit, partial [Sphingomonadales bacterium]